MNDLIQRQKALDITQSFIVQAPAGSGKTELLTQRYLKLLLVCSKPENIVAMTFSNKAADEMTQRILSALKSSFWPKPKELHKQITYELTSKVMQRSDEKGWQLLQNPKRLKISTIDGLYNLINNRYPLPSQLIPRKIMAENWERNNAYRYATEQVLLMIDDEQKGREIADLLLYLDNNVDSFQKLIVQMLSKRDQWLTRLYKDGVLNQEVLQNNAEEIIVRHLEHLQALAESYFDTNFFALMSANNNSRYNMIQSLPKCDPSDLEAWQLIAKFCLTKSGVWRKALKKKLPSELFHRELQTALQQLNFLPDVEFSQEQSDILLAIAKVLKLSVAYLNVYFEHKQAHDFIEVALNANQTLDEEKGAGDIALFLDYKIQHLLIDEFQDTSVSQFNIIEKLIDQWQDNGNKTLFLVGDPMQSIYRFRESQVSLFLQVKEEGIANIKPKSLILTTNFRSSKSIVEGNNTLFSQIFPENNNMYQGAISYSKSQSNSNKEDKNTIVFHPFVHDQSLLEAKAVSEIVQTSLKKNPYGTIAILVRARPHLKSISEQLKDDNINVESLEITKLRNHLLTRDLFSLTKALLHLGDKLAWLSVLRGLWCGLVLNDLLVLSESDDCIIYQKLNDKTILAKLSKDGQKRAQYLYHCLQDVINNQGRFNFVELFTYALNQLGLTNDALSNTKLQIKYEFLKIIHSCEAQKMLNVKTIESAMENLYIPSDKALVKLMTIHQSKGLEFDSVIIPGLGRNSRSNDNPIIQLREFSNKSLLLAPIRPAVDTNESGTYAYLKFIDSQQDKFEAMRLLYVAMTRAKSHLHLFGAVNKFGNSSRGSFLHLLMPFYANLFEGIDRTPDTVENSEAPLLKRFAQVTIIPINKTQEQGKFIECQQNFERLFKSALGTLVHQYYEQELFTPSIENIRNRLIEIGTSPKDIEHWQNFIIKLLDNTKNDEKFDWLFKDRTLSLNESEFVVGEEIITIDRLFIDDDILWVIDYKIAQPAQNESLENFIKHQQEQHAKQLLFYKKAMSEIYACQVRCALYCPSISQLIEITD